MCSRCIIVCLIADLSVQSQTRVDTGWKRKIRRRLASLQRRNGSAAVRDGSGNGHTGAAPQTSDTAAAPAHIDDAPATATPTPNANSALPAKPAKPAEPAASAATAATATATTSASARTASVVWEWQDNWRSGAVGGSWCAFDAKAAAQLEESYTARGAEIADGAQDVSDLRRVEIAIGSDHPLAPAKARYVMDLVRMTQASCDSPAPKHAMCGASI